MAFVSWKKKTKWVPSRSCLVFIGSLHCKSLLANLELEEIAL